jgi:hypothetical protein
MKWIGRKGKCSQLVNAILAHGYPKLSIILATLSFQDVCFSINPPSPSLFYMYPVDMRCYLPYLVWFEVRVPENQFSLCLECLALTCTLFGWCNFEAVASLADSAVRPPAHLKARTL